MLSWLQHCKHSVITFWLCISWPIIICWIRGTFQGLFSSPCRKTVWRKWWSTSIISAGTSYLDYSPRTDPDYLCVFNKKIYTKIKFSRKNVFLTFFGKLSKSQAGSIAVTTRTFKIKNILLITKFDYSREMFLLLKERNTP